MLVVASDTAGTMGGMKDFTDKFKLSARSTGEVSEVLANVVSRFRARRFDLGPLAGVAKGGSFSREICLNALVARFGRLSQAEQEREIREGIAVLAELMTSASGEAADAQASLDQPVVARTIAEQNLDVVEDRRERASRASNRTPSTKDPVGKHKGADRDGTPKPRR
ncbi:MAG: hypothetical protein P4L84_34915 [Isosphaeraceae bacterium]|nr:hypothetical protein [Isosphaeraceae bacterium]